MSWHGAYYRGAMRDRRRAKRTAAQHRQAAERARDRTRAMCHGKRRYASRTAANLVLLECKIRFALRRNDRRRERRSYLCPACRGFHLTSRPDRYAQPVGQVA